MEYSATRLVYDKQANDKFDLSGVCGISQIGVSTIKNDCRTAQEACIQWLCFEDIQVAQGIELHNEVSDASVR